MQEKEYNPIGCDHKKPNGFSAWSIQSGESGSGPDIDVDVHVMVCRLCGKIKVAGRRWDGKSRHVDRFSEEFHIYHPDAIDAIIKQANFYNEDAKWQRVPAPSPDLEAEAKALYPTEGKAELLQLCHYSAQAGYLKAARRYASQVDELKQENERLRDSLQKIANWELPPSGKYWDLLETEPMSYEAAYGSNGVREYIKSIAANALKPKP